MIDLSKWDARVVSRPVNQRELDGFPGTVLLPETWSRPRLPGFIFHGITPLATNSTGNKGIRVGMGDNKERELKFAVGQIASH